MIQLQHLSLRYGQKEILRDLDLSVGEARITAVMGPNGCGKTSLLRCIGGLIEPTEGAVLVDGKAVLDLSARTLAQ